MCVYFQARRLWIGGGAKVEFWEAYPPTTRSAKKTRVILSPFYPSLPKPITTSIPMEDKKGEGSSRALTLCRWAKQHWMPKRKQFAFFWGRWKRLHGTLQYYYSRSISSAGRPVNRTIFSTDSPSDFICRAISILRSSLPSALPSSNEVSNTFFKSR